MVHADVVILDKSQNSGDQKQNELRIYFKKPKVLTLFSEENKPTTFTQKEPQYQMEGNQTWCHL